MAGGMAEIIELRPKSEAEQFYCPVCGEFGWFACFIDGVFFLECMTEGCNTAVIFGDSEEI